jgi:hypothetical protein
MDTELKEELAALPLLRSYIYRLTDGDPLAGWLNAFEEVSQTTEEDLQRIAGISSGDIVYVAAAYPGQLMGVIRWLAGLGPQQRPFVLIDLLGHPGIELRPANPGYAILPRREDPRAMLYRYAANEISKHKLTTLTIAYADTVSADVYSHVLGVPVISLPLPFDAVTSRRNRKGQRPLRLSLLGSQRNAEKGYHLVPDILRPLLRSHPDLHIHVHNSYPGNFPAASEAMHAMAKTEMRIVLDEEACNSRGWAERLDKTDLMLCPYNRSAYEFMTSGVHAEAMANAIPSVVPAGTALSRALKEFGGGGTEFDRFEVSAIVEATRRALNEFDGYAEKAFAGSQMWRERCGAAKLADALVALSMSGAARLGTRA